MGSRVGQKSGVVSANESYLSLQTVETIQKALGRRNLGALLASQPPGKRELPELGEGRDYGADGMRGARASPVGRGR